MVDVLEICGRVFSFFVLFGDWTVQFSGGFCIGSLIVMVLNIGVALRMI